MTINLQKGQRISLSKEAPGLKKMMCGLGWDVAKRSGGGMFGMFGQTQDIDLDASVILLGANGKLYGRELPDTLVYFGNLTHKSGSIHHHGDNLTGDGDGDDECISVDLQRVPADVHKLVFTVNIYQCRDRNQNFGMISNAFVRLVDESSGKELMRYDLSGKDFSNATGLILAEMYRHGDEWKVAAMGEAVVVDGLSQLVSKYV